MAGFTRKRVVVTGGTSAMGLASAKLLLSEGARVLLTGRSKHSLDAVSQELGENAIIVKSDATALRDIELLVERQIGLSNDRRFVRQRRANPLCTIRGDD